MGVPTSEVGYASATTGRGDHEVHKGHVVALKNYLYLCSVYLQKTGSRYSNGTNKKHMKNFDGETKCKTTRKPMTGT
jgi:hypothetical protein